jgi:hypothetical protein
MFDHRAVSGAGLSSDRVHQDVQQIRLVKHIKSRPNHPAVQKMLGFMEAGRVKKRDLGIGCMRHAQDSSARRLRLIGYDGDLFIQ